MAIKALLIYLLIAISLQEIIGDSKTDDEKLKTDGEITNSNCGKLKKEDIDNKKSGSINRNPWQVALVKKNPERYLCGGAIVGENQVLTVAHCLSKVTPSDLSIFVGTSKLSDSPQRYDIKTITIHSEYSSSDTRNDIAIIEIKGEFKWSPKVQPLCLLGSQGGRPETGCKVSEWIPKDSETGLKFKIRETPVTIVNREECGKSFMGKRNVTEGMICALKVKDRDDSKTSGCPLVCEKNGRVTLHGLTSWGRFDNNDVPIVYTNVFLYAGWIKNKQ